MIGAILLALAPAAGLIALGWWLKRARFLPDAFWPGAERLAYFILLPALLVHSLAMADLSRVPVARLMLVIALSLTGVAALLVALRPWLAIDGPAFTSVFQGGIRFNNYVGLTVAAGLLGGPGIALAAVANATIVPVANLFCILVFAALRRRAGEPFRHRALDRDEPAHRRLGDRGCLAGDGDRPAARARGHDPGARRRLAADRPSLRRRRLRPLRRAPGLARDAGLLRGEVRRAAGRDPSRRAWRSACPAMRR